MRNAAWKFALVIAAFVALAGVFVGGARASVIVWNDISQINFKNWEGTGRDLGNPGLLDVGDTLRGVMQAQDTDGLLTLTNINLLPNQPESLGGVFELEVYSKTPAPGKPGQFILSMGPDKTGAFQARNNLPAGAMIALYKDGLPAPHDFAGLPTIVAQNGNFAAVEALITDGVLMGSFGFTDPQVLAAAQWPVSLVQYPGGQVGGNLEYWGTNATSDNFAFPGSSEYFYSLSHLGDGILGQPSIAIIPLPNHYSKDQESVPPITWGVKYDLIGEGDSSQIVDPKNPLIPVSIGDVVPGVSGYFIDSDDPARLYATPEPASVLVWAGLLVGLAGTYILRRRRKA